MNDSINNLSISPSQIAEKAVEIGIQKTRVRIVPLLILSFLAGIYIAFGGVFSAVVATGMSGTWPFGIMKMLQGVAFSLGLILVVVGGAELFTGNMLMVIAWAHQKITSISVLRNWVFVYLGNFCGSVFLAGLFTLGKTYLLSNGELGKVLFTIANTKLNYGFLQAIVLGILCNILVCLAVWLSYSAKNTSDKILSIIFPISAFIAAGFEHSVANMFLIPVTIIIRAYDPLYAANLSIDLSKLTWMNFFFHNLLPVTIGNIIGGAVFVGLLYFFSFRNSGK